MRWKFSPNAIVASAKRAVMRHGVKAAIVVAGAGVAAGTASRTTYFGEAPLVQRVAARMNTVESAALASSTVRDSSELDSGIDHSRIDSWVKRFSSSGGFKATLKRGSKYTPMITKKLEAKGMPKDLVYVAMIESDFIPTARSRVNAVGMWQFMSATAREFGLKVRGKVDERKNPALATDAAIEYLGQLYDRFGSWYLAAAAYNSGQGTVSKALRKVTGKTTGTDEDYFRISSVLPEETRDYVPKLIAAARVANAGNAENVAVLER
jgi:membrane-bound lytic murein transglycosylase D